MTKLEKINREIKILILLRLLFAKAKDLETIQLIKELKTLIIK